MKPLTLLVIVLSLSVGCYAQVSEQTINAFAASYTSENAKDYAKAINDIKLFYTDGSYEINLRLGWLYYQKKEYDASQKYYRVAMRVKPNSIEAMFGFINPAVALQNWQEIFTVYQKILTLDAYNSVANYRIALMYYYRKEFASTEKNLQKIIERYPFDYDIVLLLAQSKLALGKTSEAKIYYQRALLYNPSNSEIKSVLGKL